MACSGTSEPVRAQFSPPPASSAGPISFRHVMPGSSGDVFEFESIQKIDSVKFQIQIEELTGQVAAHEQLYARIEDMRVLERRVTHLEEKLLSASEPSIRGVLTLQEPSFRGTPTLQDQPCSVQTFGTGKKKSVAITKSATSMDTYSFQTTVWDAAVLIGLPIFGRAASLMTAFALLLAVSIQLAFCYIIFRNLATSPYDKNLLDALYKWRLFVAHDVRYVDPVTRVSLASRVCNFDPGLAFATNQQTLMMAVDSFGSFAGPALALLMLFVFAPPPINDIRLLFLQLRAFLISSKRNQHTEINAAEDGSNITIEAISRTRFFYISLVGILRLAVSIFYLIAGCLYLSYTPSITKLLLGGAALAFVMEIDERVYDVFVPIPFRHVLEQLHPLPVKHTKWPSQADPGVCCSYFVTVLMCTVCLTIFMMPMITAQFDAQSIVCGGERDFVYAISGVDGVINYAPTPAFTQLRVKGEYQVDGVSQLIGFPPELGYGTALNSMNASLARLRPFDFVDSLAAQSVSKAVSTHQCVEHLDKALEYPPWERFYEMWKLSLSTLVGIHVTVCKDVLSFCQDPLMIPVRALCPITCGCANLTSSLFFSKSEYGCPPTCRFHNTYMVQIKKTPCKDLDLDNPQSQHAWRVYWLQYVAVRSLAGDTASATQLHDMALKVGCSIVFFMLTNHGVDMCDDVIGAPWEGRALLSWCPLTCGCKNKQRDSCPESCEDIAGGDDAGDLVGFTRAPLACDGFESSEHKTVCDLGAVVLEGVSSTCCNGLDGAVPYLREGLAVPSDVLIAICCSHGCTDAGFSEKTDFAHLLWRTGKSIEDFCLVSNSSFSTAGGTGSTAQRKGFESNGDGFQSKEYEKKGEGFDSKKSNGP